MLECNPTPNETWKPIPGWPGYEVSNLGRVRSFKKYVGRDWAIAEEPQRILSPSSGDGGYKGVNLSYNSTVVYRRIAHLVLEAFLGSRPDGMQVCHNDCNKANDRLDNLRYDTPSGNRRDGAGKHTKTRLTKNQATKVKCLAAQGVTDSDLAGEFGVSAGSIRRCRLGHSYAYAVGPITKRPHRSRPPEIADKNIGSKLRTARLRSGKHQGKLAEEVGISQAHLSRVELGKDNPSKDLVYRLQAATGIQVLIAEHVKDRK